jgi:hypothetical protein
MVDGWDRLGGWIGSLSDPTAVHIHQRHDLTGVLAQNPVVPPIRTTAGMGLLVSPVLDIEATLHPPSIGMKCFDHIHGSKGANTFSNYQPPIRRLAPKQQTDFGIRPFMA